MTVNECNWQHVHIFIIMQFKKMETISLWVKCSFHFISIHLMPCLDLLDNNALPLQHGRKWPPRCLNSSIHEHEWKGWFFFFLKAWKCNIILTFHWHFLKMCGHISSLLICSIFFIFFSSIFIFSQDICLGSHFCFLFLHTQFLKTAHILRGGKIDGYKSINMNTLKIMLYK